MTPAEATMMWIAESGPAYREGNTTACAPVVSEGHTLPKGLRGMVTAARSECGPEWSFVKFEVAGYPQLRSGNFYVPTRVLSTTPPPGGWDTVKSTGPAYTRQAGDKPTLGLPLDDPKWSAPALVPGGELVERLAEDVIRTASGHELWIDPFYLADVDPLGRKDYSANERSVPLRRRFVAGLASAEVKRPLQALPTPAELARLPVGAVVYFSIDPAWIVDARFSPEWFDPVGQSMEHTCDKYSRAGQPCGRYDLDYSAFGAWLPTHETEVVARWTGKLLAVQVMEPWSDAIAVSPAWDSPVN